MQSTSSRPFSGAGSSPPRPLVKSGGPNRGDPRARPPRVVSLAARVLRKLWRHALGLGLALAVLLQLLMGGFSPSVLFGSALVPQTLGLPASLVHPSIRVLLASVLVILLSGKLGERLLRKTAPARPLWRFVSEFEGGAALLGLTFALLQLLGGSRALIHPLSYAVCAFLVSFHRRSVSLALAVLTLLYDFALLFSEGSTRPDQYLVRGLLIAAFAGLQFSLVRGELWRQRSEHDRRVADAISDLQQQARDFRLLIPTDGPRRELTPSATVSGRQQSEELLTRGATLSLAQNLSAMTALVKDALALQTCVLHFVSEDSTALKLVAMSSSADGIAQQPLAIDAGIIGTVFRTQRPQILTLPKASQLSYYAAGGYQVTAFLGVPLCKDGKVIGVLCADRAGTADRPTPFSEADQRILTEAGSLILRSVECERLFMAVERSQYEHERLYHASARLSGALTQAEVLRTSFSALAEICEFDFAALTAYDPQEHVHRVLAAEGDPMLTAAVDGLQFPDNTGLVAMSIKNQIILPRSGELRDHYTPIFDTDLRLRSYSSLLIVPLLVGRLGMGTLVVAAKRSAAFGASKTGMLGVLANQIAASLENARIYQTMESMATTDGLTHLKNRRVFQDRLGDMCRRSERHGGQFSLILADIDHFKKINDTYGHLVGDQVLKRVAQVLLSTTRTIDIAARYGGEEFALLLDSTDLTGARLLAERIRQEVSALTFHTEKGVLQCTISLGLAAHPHDVEPGQEAFTDGRGLISAADRALYQAKREGRNRALAFPDLQAARSAA